MARIRSAKPEWWTDAKMCALSRDVRFTYKGLIEVMADDEGRFLADPRLVKGQVWPLDDDLTVKKIAGFLEQLAKAGRIVLYESEGGKYGLIPTFLAHQKISHPTPSKFPATPERFRNLSGAVPEVLRPDVDLDLDVDVDVEGASRETPGILPEPDQPALVVPAVVLPAPKMGAPSADETLVLEHYKRRHPKRKPEKNPKNLRLIRQQLANYTAAELCRAIDGNADDEWHKSQGLHDLDYVLRNANKIDTFLAKAAVMDEYVKPWIEKDPAMAYARGVFVE